MTLALIIALLAFGACLLLLLFQRRELRHIVERLRALRSTDTNGLLPSETGLNDPLIREINALLRDENEVRQSYRQRSHALDQMVTNVSHDLRTPLTSALGYIELIVHSGLPEEEKRRALRQVEDRLRRLEELIDSFFALSKAVSGEKPPELETLNLVAVLEESIAHFYDDYCARGRQIAFFRPEQRLPVLSNRSMLLRIFDNLIANALKHGTGDLTIRVRSGDGVFISFENETQFLDLDVTRVFDEFYTADISRTAGNTGLGLAIARQFTRMLRGEARAALDGKRFTVELQFPSVSKISAKSS